MRSLRELCEREAPLPWQRTLEISRALAVATQRLVGQPALCSEGILIDGGQVHVTTLPDRPSRTEIGEEHAFVDSAVRLWKNMADREPVSLHDHDLFAYMAPEQLMGKPLDERRHVYSIGVITYELLTKRVPFSDAEGPSEIITAQLKREPQPPSTRAAVPPEVDALVLRCLRKRPAERFANLDALAAAIDELWS